MKKNLIRWIVINQHPFTIVEKDHFITFVHSLYSLVRLPTADTIKNKIMAYYKVDKVKMKIILKDLSDKISFTTDC